MRRVRKSTIIKLFVGTIFVFITLAFIIQKMEIGSPIGSQSNEDGYDRIKLLDLGAVKNVKEAEAQKIGYDTHKFNVFVSDKLPSVRAIPDSRPPGCPHLAAADIPLRATVIICFYNEAKSVLLRTVDSVLARSPLTLLDAIVLVDDFSDLEETAAAVAALKARPKVDGRPELVFARNPQREGLIRSRMRGAALAKGEVLLFLDSHVEPNRHWLEPLLAQLSSKPKDVALPVVDIISDQTMEYVASPLVRGGFSWGLRFNWIPPPEEVVRNKGNDHNKPIRSPTMSGGLLAIRRDWYYKLGDYDQGMDTWGGENLEMSFRVWQCGGSIHVVPCSRVGHVFRSRRPYGEATNRDSWLYNSLRMAHVWMDEYIEQFYKIRGNLQHYPAGDLRARNELRKHLRCRSFKWYLESVYPELLASLSDIVKLKPTPDPNLPNVLLSALFALGNYERCITVSNVKDSEKALGVSLMTCDTVNFRQHISLTNIGEVRFASHCLDGSISPVKFRPCHGKRGAQEWVLTRMSRLQNVHTDKCLTRFVNGVVGMGQCLVKAPENGNKIIKIDLR